MNKFSEILKALRASRNISQNDLAEIIGLSKSSINMYERGEREPGFEAMEAFADYFNVDVDYLLGRSDLKNKAAQFLSTEGISTINAKDKDGAPVLSEKERELIEKLRSYNEDEKQRIYDTFDIIDREIVKDKTIIRLLREEQQKTYGAAAAFGGETVETAYGSKEKDLIDSLLKQLSESENME